MSHLTYGSPLHYRRLARDARPTWSATARRSLAGDMNLWGPPIRVFLRRLAPGGRRARRGRRGAPTARSTTSSSAASRCRPARCARRRVGPPADRGPPVGRLAAVLDPARAPGRVVARRRPARRRWSRRRPAVVGRHDHPVFDRRRRRDGDPPRPPGRGRRRPVAGRARRRRCRRGPASIRRTPPPAPAGRSLVLAGRARRLGALQSFFSAPRGCSTHPQLALRHGHPGHAVKAAFFLAWLALGAELVRR